MNIHLRSRFIPALLILLLPAGCGDDDPAGPEDGLRGSLSFRYQPSGQAAQSFSAEGEVRLDANREPEFGTWAAAARDPSSNSLSIVGFRAGTAQQGDFFAIAIPNTTQAGTFNFDCDFEDPGSECENGGLLALGVNLDDENDLPDRFYFLSSGTVRVTSITDQRVRGTFEASGFSVDLRNPFAESVPVTVSGGTFDVPLVEELGVEPAVSRGRESVPPLR